MELFTFVTDRKAKQCVFLTILMLGILIPILSFAQIRVGITAGAGAGLFIASDKDYYGGISTDLYPEIGFQLDASFIRLGLRFAYIYRKIEETYWWYDYSYHWEYTVSYLPAQFEFLIAPLDAISKDNLISPYAGLMAGAFIATGDNNKTLPAFSLKLGSELHLDPLMAYGDVRYTYAPNSDADVNAGGFMIVAGLGLRLGLSK